eukprot:7098_1
MVNRDVDRVKEQFSCWFLQCALDVMDACDGMQCELAYSTTNYGDLLDNKLCLCTGNINLDQQFVDFIDTFSIGQCVGDSFVSNYPRFNTFHRKSRQLSVSGISIDRAKRQYFTS